jgi:mitochondrial translocator assembly and maintenance protein 41
MDEKLLSAFPPTKFAFAYGSAVSPQAASKSVSMRNDNYNMVSSSRMRVRQGKMLDLIFAVDNPVAWHSQNLARNSGHYSLLRCLGPQTIAAVQAKGAGVYYNPAAMVNNQVLRFVHWQSRSGLKSSCLQLIKYGVIGIDRLKQDLLEWNYLYIAGRLHKPVSDSLRMSDDQGFRCANCNPATNSTMR